MFARDRTLLVGRFDTDRLSLVGSPAQVIENVASDAGGAPLVALSHTGTLAYVPLAASSRLVWVSRQGVEQPVGDTPRRYQNPRAARRSERVIVSADGDLWEIDARRGSATRFAIPDGGSGWPVLTPDDGRVIFAGRDGMKWRPIDGSRAGGDFAETSATDFPTSVSPDGEVLAFLRLSGTTSGDIYTLQLSGPPNIRPLLTTAAYESGAQFSPDGRWLAYVSNDSGQFEVYVRPFRGADRRWQVSTHGGTHPRWGRNGKELFYRVGQKMMAVEVSGGADPTFGSPRALFEQPYAFATQTIANYDLSADGGRFLMVKDDLGAGRLNVILDWSPEPTRGRP